MKHKVISFNGVVFWSAGLEDMTKEEKYQTVWDKILAENQSNKDKGIKPKLKRTTRGRIKNEVRMVVKPQPDPWNAIKESKAIPKSKHYTSVWG
jgi:hypothetical protein